MTIEEKNIAEFRVDMTDVFNRVYYTGTQFRIMKRTTPVARVVPEKLMLAFEQLLEEDAALEETLELMLNKNLRQEVEQSITEAEAGEGVTGEEFFKELHGN